MGLNELTIGLDFRSNFPDGSYLAAYWQDTEDNFDALSAPSYLVVTEPDLRDRNVQKQLEDLIAAVDEEPVVTSAVRSWLEDYRDYAALVRATPNSTEEDYAVEGDRMYKDLRRWLSIKEYVCPNPPSCTRAVIPRTYRRDFVWGRDDEGRRFLNATRLSCRVEFPPDSLEARIASTNAFRAVVANNKGDLDVRAWAQAMSFSDRDSILAELVVGTLVIAGAAVVLSLALFLSLVSVCIGAFCVAFVDGFLFLVMLLTETPLDVASFICLAISIGISVDALLHVAFAYEHTPALDDAAAGPTRLATALAEIGTPVLKAQFSSFLGVCLLALSESEVFRIFFRLLTASIIASALSGFVVYPAAAARLQWLMPVKANLPAPGPPRPENGAPARTLSSSAVSMKASAASPAPAEAPAVARSAGGGSWRCL